MPQIVDRNEEDLTEVLERMGKIGIGCTMGMTLGYVGMKIGKVAAFASGCGLLYVLITNKKGYVKYKSKNVGDGAVEIKKKLQNELNGGNSNYSAIAFLADRDVYLTGGFISGMLLGFSLS